jgi:DNA ligase-associated metallophosphoesterase
LKSSYSISNVVHPIQGETFQLLPDRALYWEEQSALILADTHFGKAAHFRKAGIAVPAHLIEADLRRLQQLITRHHPLKIIVVGDMFHSNDNQDVSFFALWRKQFPHIQFILVAGNHDVLSAQKYVDMEIEKVPYLRIQNIGFIHDASTQNAINQDAAYTFSGHIHPGVSLLGAARQRLKLPCFYFGKEVGILPAFSLFTGLCLMEPQPATNIYVIAKEQVIKI